MLYLVDQKDNDTLWHVGDNPRWTADRIVELWADGHELDLITERTKMTPTSYDGRIAKFYGQQAREIALAIGATNQS